MSDDQVQVIDARLLSKHYGRYTAVDAVDVKIRRGEFWGLLGPNGAGKTTFLRMITGAIAPSSGSLRVLEYPVPAQARPMRRRIGVVPQLDNLDPDFSVIENLRTYAGYFGLSGPDLDTHIEGLLEFAALESKRDARISALSGGMQRRLSLVRALVNQPDLLILDEPTTGLDPQARQLMWQRLRELKSKGITVVLTTHYMEEAQRLCDRITIMDHGRLLDSASPSELIKRHIEPHVVEVYGDDAEAWHLGVGAGLADRSEQVGETWLYYALDEEPLVDALKASHGISYLHRPANLEDVFVKLTGRELREA